MKRILFLLAFVSIITASFAQVTTPVKGPTAQYSQMWNTSSYYYNTVTAATQLGAQIDTITNVASINLVTSQLFFTDAGKLASYTLSNAPTKVLSTFVNNDTVIVTPLDGSGQVVLTCEVYKCTGTDTVIITPISSSDGVYWATIPGATAVTVTPTSLTVPIITKFKYDTKPDKYLGVQVSNQKTSSTVSARSQCYFLKPTTLNKDL